MNTIHTKTPYYVYSNVKFEANFEKPKSILNEM